MNARIPIALLASTCFFGCGVLEMHGVAAQHAPADLACPRERVSQLRHGSGLATQPAFHGCGRYVVYHCMSTVGDSGETQCVPIASGNDTR